MNYAEAVYKYLGSPYATDSEFTTSAVDAIKVVRTRAEMPGFPTNMSNDAFWKKYQNERMVELAFEGHRFWDVRRWKEGDKHFNNIVEMKITKNDDGTYAYERKTKMRMWDDKMYFFPIPQSERSKNPNLEQNRDGKSRVSGKERKRKRSFEFIIKIKIWKYEKNIICYYGCFVC